MKKEELLKENAQLQNKIANLTLNGREAREEISGMLGSYETESYYGGRTEKKVKVLTWPQIYFRLGKLKQRVDRLEDLSYLRQSIDNLQRHYNEMQQSEPSDDPLSQQRTAKLQSGVDVV